MNFKEIWYFCASQTCKSQSTSLQTTEINYIVASHWLKPTAAQLQSTGLWTLPICSFPA